MYLLLLSHFAHKIICTDHLYLNIGNCFTDLFRDTLSFNSACPPEILQNAELNNGKSNNSQRQQIKKRAGIRNKLRKRAHSPPLPSILLSNVQSLENKLDEFRARLSFQRDIRDCNIICLTETWLNIFGPGHSCNGV